MPDCSQVQSGSGVCPSHRARSFIDVLTLGKGLSLAHAQLPHLEEVHLKTNEAYLQHPPPKDQVIEYVELSQSGA